MMKDHYNIRLPKSWNEITLGMLEKIEGEHDNPMKILSILSNTPEEEISQMPVQFIDKLSENISFLKNMPDVTESHSIRYKGNTYMINVMEKLTFGEYVAIQMLLKANQHDYSGFLAVLCRQQGEKYDATFENQTLQKRKEMFQNMPVKRVLPVIAFFLNWWLKFNSIDKTLNQTKTTVLEEIENILEDTKNMKIDGHGRRFYTNLLRIRLRRLQKYINRTF